MNKTQFNKIVKDVLAKHLMTSNEKTANNIINIFLESVTTALKDNDEITFVGFGKFYKTNVAARTGRNPQTGESMNLNAYIQPRFAAGKNLKEACNNKDVDKKAANKKNIKNRMKST